jgi:uncharacterized damage-inducible protein DinB
MAMPATLTHYLLTQAYNNAWSNHRLLRACGQLPQAQFEAERTNFFPSIVATLNHILTVDWFYIDALERAWRGDPPHPDYLRFFDPEQPFASCAALAPAQRASDQRLIDYCRGLDDARLENMVTIQRTDRVQRDCVSRLLAHLFQHQVHHRGQVHAMLAGTTVAPPQLDEFFAAGERHLREQDFRELGWTEETIWGSAPADGLGREIV